MQTVEELRRARAIVFDLDDTLVDWSGAQAAALRGTVAACLGPRGVAAETALAAYEQVLEENRRSHEATGRWWTSEDRFGLLLEHLGIPDGPLRDMVACHRRHLRDGTRFLAGAEEVLERARRGRRLGLLTNGLPEVQRPKVDGLGVGRRVHHVAISGETGRWKPAPEAFLDLLGALRVAPEESVMVGDSLRFDMRPAKELGMGTVWVRPPEREAWVAIAEAPAARPSFVDHEVGAPAELLRHL